MALELFHEHRSHVADQEMKERLKKKLDDDEYCVEQLQRLENKGCSYDQLWADKLLSDVSCDTIH